MEMKGKKALVVGLGISGQWTARWLAGQGAHVVVSEMKPETALDPQLCRELAHMGITLETGGHGEEIFLTSDIIIVSPGVPHEIGPLMSAGAKGIPVIGELELAGRLIDTPIIAVTGTNGKSTVTEFLGTMLRNEGLEVFVGGNIGIPLMAYVQGEIRADYAVVEVSSFQLDTIEGFCPFISIVLNISADHLDRYPDYDAYVAAKLKIFGNQGPGQHVILNDDDSRLRLLTLSSGVSVLRYGMDEKEGRHAFIKDGMVTVCLGGQGTKTFSLDPFHLPGQHNLENLLAVVLCGLTLDISPSVIRKSIARFKGLPNRCEKVAELDGVLYYNDSKATNVDAAARSVTGFDRPLVLIAGGRHKGADYRSLVNAARKRVKRAIFLGEASDLMAASFEGILPISFAKDMEEAVSMAFSWAERGDIVLLAPACSSFDMFSDYSHRGKVFRTAVEKLSHG